MELIHRFIDTVTGEVIDKPYTKKELDELKINQKRIDAELVEAEAKAQAKATAEAKLAALGLTTNDLRALGL